MHRGWRVAVEFRFRAKSAGVGEQRGSAVGGGRRRARARRRRLDKKLGSEVRRLVGRASARLLQRSSAQQAAGSRHRAPHLAAAGNHTAFPSLTPRPPILLPPTARKGAMRRPLSTSSSSDGIGLGSQGAGIAAFVTTVVGYTLVCVEIDRSIDAAAVLPSRG